VITTAYVPMAAFGRPVRMQSGRPLRRPCPTGFRLCKTNSFFVYLNSRNEAILKKLSDSLATTDLN
jgi:hypothetical protein